MPFPTLLAGLYLVLVIGDISRITIQKTKLLDNKKRNYYGRRNDSLEMRRGVNLLIGFLPVVGAVFGVEGKKGI